MKEIGTNFVSIHKLDGGLEPLAFRLPVHCSTNSQFLMLLIACMNVACFIVVLLFNYDVICIARDINI